MNIINMNDSKFRLRINTLKKECEKLKINTFVYGNPVTGIIFIVGRLKTKESEWVITINDSLTKPIKEVIKEFKTEYDVLRLLDQI